MTRTSAEADISPEKRAAAVPTVAADARRVPARQMPGLGIELPIEMIPGRVGGYLKLAWPVFVVFLAQRVLTVAFVYHDAGTLRSLVSRWDAGWYLRLAQGGYVYPNVTPEGRIGASNLAYFPLFPLLARWISGSGLVSLSGALIVLSWVGGLLAVSAIFTFGNALYGRSVGIVLCALWGMAPASLTLTMGYPESMFVAAAAITVFCLIRRRPVWAGASAAVAGLLRPTAVVLIATVGLYFLVEFKLWLAWRQSYSRCSSAGVGHAAPQVDVDAGKPAPGRAFAGVALSTLGVAAFMDYAGVRTHQLFGYFTVQHQWGLRAAASLAEYLDATKHGLFASPPATLTPVTIAVSMGYLLLFCLVVWDRRLAWASVYAGLLLVTSLSHVTFQHAYARELLAGAFVLLVPLARMRVPRIGATSAIVLGSILMSWGSAQFLVTPGTGM